MAIISLLSDFGHKDPYVAEMKAVILSINPTVRIVDVTHEIEKFNIRMGAYVLASAAPYFPKNTVHVAVVDPGVGTKRRSIIVETRRSLYVGPDNGLLMLAAHKEHMTNVYEIDNPEYMLPRVSKTFHGRDIFAPAAAHLTEGNKPSTFGPAIHDYIVPDFVKPRQRNGELLGEVLHIDDFGNTISNISAEDLKKMGINEGYTLHVRLGGKTMTLKFCSAYGEVPVGAPLALIGGSNFLEVAVNQKSASRSFKAKVGDAFHVSVAVSS
jgi:S-adenosyl-L-methionine hydrolase (adenosine-forming)